MEIKKTWDSFNADLYAQIHNLREQKEGYCFKLALGLGPNGLVRNHPLVGRCVERTEDDEFNEENHKGKRYVIESVHIHYWGGYYLVLLIKDQYGSHTQLFFENINCEDEIIIDILNEQKQKFRLLEEKEYA